MTIAGLEWDQPPAPECRGGAVAIGNFDGVHRGHAALMAELRAQARARGGPAVALTFEPHPLRLLRPEQFQPVLTTPRDRAELLAAAGADHVLLLHTTPELLHLSARAFFEEVLVKRLAATVLVEGTNFGFGRDREGNIETLGALGREHGLNLVVVQPVLVDGRPVSSSRVRNVLVRGAVDEAIRLLNRPYRLRGLVGRGQARGRLLGFPTANLEQIETLIPGDGVYAVRVLAGDRSWPGAANIGPNPTFGEKVRKVEAHLIGFEGDLQGQPLAVDFIARLRATRAFPGVAALIEQLRQDVEQARAILAAR